MYFGIYMYILVRVLCDGQKIVKLLCIIARHAIVSSVSMLDEGGTSKARLFLKPGGVVANANTNPVYFLHFMQIISHRSFLYRGSTRAALAIVLY